MSSKMPRAGKLVRAAREVPVLRDALRVRVGVGAVAGDARGARREPRPGAGGSPGAGRGGAGRPGHTLSLPPLRKVAGVASRGGGPEGELPRVRATPPDSAALQPARERAGSDCRRG